MTRIFIRDDDVGGLTPAFTDFFRLFRDRGLPVSYQIIPEQLTEDCAEFLKQELAKAPQLVDVGQHGLRHQMMVRGKLEFYEFGPERTYDEQLADIREGARILRERLGDFGDVRVFTPPRHRYDRNTLKAAKAVGFSVLSASSYTGVKHRAAYQLGRALGMTNLGRPGVPWHGRTRPDSGLFELSVAVGVDDGSKIAGTPQDVIAAIEGARRHTGDVGILFHHNAFEGAEGGAYLDDLTGRLLALKDVTFHTIGDLHRRAAGAAA